MNKAVQQGYNDQVIYNRVVVRRESCKLEDMEEKKAPETQEK